MLARWNGEGEFESIFKKKSISVSDEANNVFGRIESLDEFNMPANSEEWDKWAKSIKLTDDNLKNFLTTKEKAYQTKDLATYTQYLNDHNKTLDLATLKTKAWAFAKNMAVNAAIGLAMYGVNLLIKQFDKWIVTTEESREALANLKSECQTIESDLKATNDELEVTRQRMDELEGKGTLTFTEKEEYDNLVKQNNELQRTIDLLKLEQKEKNKEKNKTFVETMEKDVEQYGEYHVSDYGGKVKKGHGGRDIGMNTDEKAYINQQFKDYQDNLAKMAELDAQYKDDLSNKQYQKDRKRLEDQNNKISEYLRDKNTEFTTDADGIEYIENPSNEDEEKVNKWLDFINDFQDRMAIAMGGDNAETNAFNRVVDNWQFDETVQGLQDLGEEGKVTAGMLDDPKYDKFIQKLVDLGVIDSADNLDDIALAFNNVGTEAENASENANKMTVSLSDLEKVSGKISKVSAAFKELSDNGYLTISTINDLQNETGLSGDEWAKYETRLLNAKKGSADFNQVLSELTYKILENQVATIDLTNATDDEITAIENKIAATLRENGVVNANAVAHDYVTQARVRSKTATYDFIDATQDDIDKLLEEMRVLGLTETAIGGLSKAYTEAQSAMSLAASSGALNRLRISKEELKGIKTVADAYRLMNSKGYDVNGDGVGDYYGSEKNRPSFDKYREQYNADVANVTALAKAISEIDSIISGVGSTTPKYSIPGGNSGSGNNDPDYQDSTEATINRINLRAEEIKQQEEYIENELEMAEIEDDYQKKIGLTNTLITQRQKRLKELENANSSLKNEITYLQNSNPWDEESWFDSQGNATETYYNLYNSSSKADQEKIKATFDAISKYSQALKGNEAEITQLEKDIAIGIRDDVELYLEDVENKYKDVGDEKKYINDLQWALNNLKMTAEERLEVEEKIEDAYKNQHSGAIQDIDHEMEMFLEENPYADLGKFYVAKKEETLNEIDRAKAKLKKAGVSDEDIAKNDYVQELQRNYAGYSNDELDWRYSVSQSWIDDRNTFGDWRLFDDSEIDAWKRVIKWLNEDYPNDLDKIKEAEKKLFEARKKEFNDATNFSNTYLESQKTLLQAHFDTTNSIREARHEINKELETSKTMYEYLDDDTRKLLFNQEDFNKLSEELNTIEYKSLKLQKDYQEALDGATLETIESITSEYQMQYETLMKSYEIAKADLEIAKKKQQLNNALNERNVRMFINGEWQWVANTEDVANAKAELADAEYAKRVEESGLAQQNSINAITKRQDELGVVIKQFENGVIDLVEATSLAKQAIGSMPRAISSLYSKAGVKYYSFKPDSSGGGSNQDDWQANVYNSNDYAAGIESALAQGDVDAALAANKIRNEKIDYLGLDVEKWSDDDIKKRANAHADGTRYTPGGLTLMGEEDSEIYISANGRLIPINQPTIGNIPSGGVVFNSDQMKSIRTLWDMSNLNLNAGASYINRSSQQTVQTIDNRIIINGMTVDSGSSDGQALISALRRYVGNH